MAFCKSSGRLSISNARVLSRVVICVSRRVHSQGDITFNFYREIKREIKRKIKRKIIYKFYKKKYRTPNKKLKVVVVRKSYTTNNNKLTNSPTNLLKMNSSKVFATTMLNGLNDAIRETLSDVLSRMKDAENASDCREIVEKMMSDVKTNKKVDKVKKPRYSGYHIYMREHRVVVKTEQPELTPQQLTSVVAKSWKDVSEEKKAEFNNRAAKMKADASSSESDSDTSQSDGEKVEKPKKAEKPEKPKKVEKAEKVEKPKKAEKVEKPKKAEKSKKKTKDTQVEDIEVELVSENESDIDI